MTASQGIGAGPVGSGGAALRVQVTIPEELDSEATEEAKRLGISKSELIRRGLIALLPDRRMLEDDPWRDLAGFGSEDLSTEPGEIDDLVYGS